MNYYIAVAESATFLSIAHYSRLEFDIIDLLIVFAFYLLCKELILHLFRR